MAEQNGMTPAPADLLPALIELTVEMVCAERDEEYLRPRRSQIATLRHARAEIERLRQRLSKIAHAPVPEDNEIAMTLKRWAMPRDGEDAIHGS